MLLIDPSVCPLLPPPPSAPTVITFTLLCVWCGRPGARVCVCVCLCPLRQSWGTAFAIVATMAATSLFLDLPSLLQMFIPWKATPPAPAEAPRVRWEIFRFLNWVTSFSFLISLVHLLSVRSRGLSAIYNAKFAFVVCLLSLVRAPPSSPLPRTFPRFRCSRALIPPLPLAVGARAPHIYSCVYCSSGVRVEKRVRVQCKSVRAR